MMGDPLTREIHRLTQGQRVRSRAHGHVVVWAGCVVCAAGVGWAMPPIAGIDLERATGIGSRPVPEAGAGDDLGGVPAHSLADGGLGGAVGEAIGSESEGSPGSPLAGDASKGSWFLEGWTKRVEVGANGVQGNAEGASLRANVQASRGDERTQASIGGVYEYATSRGDVTQNRLAVNGRAERLMVGSAWRSFVLGSYETDQFRDWDHRLTAGGGFGYQFIRSERTSLIARGGMSAARDLGGLDERIRPEAILGLDFTHSISERQRVSGALDFLPDVADTRAYRVNTRASWEVMIDPESHLSLRIGGENRYDATASGGSRRDDLSYFAVLAVEF